MSIIVNMACGLANRMFQYSYYLYLKKNGYEAKVDFYHSAKLAHEKVAWNEIFPDATIDQASSWTVFKTGGGADVVSKIRRKYIPALTKVIYMPTAFDAFIPFVRNDAYVIGVFQNAVMVTSVEDEVRRCFRFQPFTDKRNLELEMELKSCESVAIHVRKGDDYMKRIWYQDTCPMDYYLRAIEEVKERVHNPRFYVFADNKDWVKEHFEHIDYTLAEGNPASGWGSHFDMQLMSVCKHNIISNSTYSWWSAFLNNHSDKLVIGPKIWFNPDSCEEFVSDRSMCKDWILI